MVMILGFLISFAAGWSIVAADALFRAEERPGIFRGTPGMVLLLTVAGVGGLTIAGAVIWFLQSMISAAVLVILAGGWCSAARRPRSCTSMPPGAANRMMVGLAVLVVLYGLVWTYLPPAPPPTPPAADRSPGRAPVKIASQWTFRGLSGNCAPQQSVFVGFVHAAVSGIQPARSERGTPRAGSRP